MLAKRTRTLYHQSKPSHPGTKQLVSSEIRRGIERRFTVDACTVVFPMRLIAGGDAARELGQAMPISIQRQLEAVGYAQLCEDRGDVVAYCGLADV
jgi:hypothetical protein